MRHSKQKTHGGRNLHHMCPDSQSQPPVFLRDKKDPVDGLAEVREGGVGGWVGGRRKLSWAWRWRNKPILIARREFLLCVYPAFQQILRTAVCSGLAIAHALNVTKTIIGTSAQPLVRTHARESTGGNISLVLWLHRAASPASSIPNTHRREGTARTRSVSVTKNQVKRMFTRNYASLLRLLQKTITQSASSLAAWAPGARREFLFDDLYLRSCGPRGGGKRHRSSHAHFARRIRPESINRSEESGIDPALGQCQLSEIITGFINGVTVKYAWPCCCERKKLEAALPLRVITR